jgi:2-haloacid dehalogenase
MRTYTVIGHFRRNVRFVLPAEAFLQTGNPLIEPRFPELRLFRRIFLSADFGSAKPDPSIFEWAISEIAVGKSDILFIDDNGRNVSAAQKVGLPSLLFVSSVELQRSLTGAGILPRR